MASFARNLNKAPAYLSPCRRPAMPGRTFSNSSELSLASNDSRPAQDLGDVASSAPGTPLLSPLEGPRSKLPEFPLPCPKVPICPRRSPYGLNPPYLAHKTLRHRRRPRRQLFSVGQELPLCNTARVPIPTGANHQSSSRPGAGMPSLAHTITLARRIPSSSPHHFISLPRCWAGDAASAPWPRRRSV